MKTWTKEEIASKLATNDQWLNRGLLAIYERQTAEEKLIGSTRLHNRVGFNAYDARVLTSLAKQLKSGWPLTRKQLGLTRKLMRKYCGQLALIANESQEVPINRVGE